MSRLGRHGLLASWSWSLTSPPGKPSLPNLGQICHQVSRFGWLLSPRDLLAFVRAALNTPPALRAGHIIPLP